MVVACYLSTEKLIVGVLNRADVNQLFVVCSYLLKMMLDQVNIPWSTIAKVVYGKDDNRSYLL